MGLSFRQKLKKAGKRLKRGEGYAPGWQVRCPKCGLTVDAGKAVIIRIGYVGTTGRKYGYCERCDKNRWLIVEAAREESSDTAAE